MDTSSIESVESFPWIEATETWFRLLGDYYLIVFCPSSVVVLWLAPFGPTKSFGLKIDSSYRVDMKNAKLKGFFDKAALNFLPDLLIATLRLPIDEATTISNKSYTIEHSSIDSIEFKKSRVPGKYRIAVLLNDDSGPFLRSRVRTYHVEYASALAAEELIEEATSTLAGRVFFDRGNSR